MIYTGPRNRLSPSRLGSLPAHVAVQRKVDGCYATVTTDGAGRIASVISRAGRPLDEGRDLLGILAAPPHSVLVGELEASTEAGVAAAAARGYRALHLFDCLAVRGASVASSPYAARHAWLHEMRDDLLTRADDRGRMHAPDGSGLYATHPDRVLPIVPIVRGHDDARALWDAVQAEGGEGLVAVDLRAPAGKGKRKVKLTDTAECRVLAVSPGLLRLTAPTTSPAGWRGGSFLVGSHSHLADRLSPGAIVEVAHDGCFRSGLPRFPRVVRVRTDLALSPSWRRVAA